MKRRFTEEQIVKALKSIDTGLSAPGAWMKIAWIRYVFCLKAPLLKGVESLWRHTTINVSKINISEARNIDGVKKNRKLKSTALAPNESNC